MFINMFINMSRDLAEWQAERGPVTNLHVGGRTLYIQKESFEL